MPFTVTLEKEDIIALLKGTEPPTQLISFFVDKDCGSMLGGHNIEWKWNAFGMEKHSEVELYGMYLACKKIKALEENNEETDSYVHQFLSVKKEIGDKHHEFVELLKEILNEYIKEGRTATQAVNNATFDVGRQLANNSVNQFIGYQIFVNVLETHGETANELYKLSVDAVNILKEQIHPATLKELQMLIEKNEK